MPTPHNDTANSVPELVVVKSIEIRASPREVWHVLTDPDQSVRWMAGAHVESPWTIGSEITFSGQMPNFNQPYRDRGTVLAVASEKLLQYSLWNEISHLPDLPRNRTLITFVLEGADEQTHLTVRREHSYSEVAYQHANFFWGSALYALKQLAEQATR